MVRLSHRVNLTVNSTLAAKRGFAQSATDTPAVRCGRSCFVAVRVFQATPAKVTEQAAAAAPAKPDASVSKATEQATAPPAKPVASVGFFSSLFASAPSPKLARKPADPAPSDAVPSKPDAVPQAEHPGQDVAPTTSEPAAEAVLAAAVSTEAVPSVSTEAVPAVSTEPVPSVSTEPVPSSTASTDAVTATSTTASTTTSQDEETF